MAAKPHGVVLVHVVNDRYGRAHEQATRAEIARRLAALKGFRYLAEEEARPGSGPVYVVPSDTLTAAEADALGIRGEHDLFGGVVPHPFVATKAITHPLVGPDAAAPDGWSRRVRPAGRGRRAARLHGLQPPGRAIAPARGCWSGGRCA